MPFEAPALEDSAITIVVGRVLFVDDDDDAGGGDRDVEV